MLAVESQRSVRSAPTLPLASRLGPVRIAVTDRDRALSIWRDVVGLELMAETPDLLSLGAGGKPLIELELGATRPFPDKSLGLYHVAIHVPTRADLAQMALRALQRRVRISPTDHLVSEAIYLWDADNNGIEITFETPWRGSIGDPEEGLYVRTRDGSQHNGREPIDLDDLFGELGENPALQQSMPAGTRIGHVHLHLTDLELGMRFYRDGIGFGGLFIIRRFGIGDVGLDYMPHAIAFNIWAGPNAGQPPGGTAGLRYLTVVVPDAGALDAVRQRLASIGVSVSDIDGGFEALDPAENRVHVIVG